MTRGRFLLSHVRGVAIRAVARLLILRQFVLNGNDLGISCFLVVFVTSHACGNGNIGSQSTQTARSRNIDVTRRALRDVFTFATLMTEHGRLAHRQIDPNECSSRLMATGTVIAGRLLIFPMAVEAGVMRVRHGLEKAVYLRGCANRLRGGRDVDLDIRLVTNRAVVVVRLFLIIRLEERSAYEAHCFVRVAARANGSDHVLMFVVRKLDRELPFISWFLSLAGAIRFAENEAPVFARRGAHVTNRTNRRTGADERLSREKLLSMTTDAGIVVWKVSSVRKVTFCRPRRRNLVTGVAGQTLVLVG